MDKIVWRSLLQRTDKDDDWDDEDEDDEDEDEGLNDELGQALTTIAKMLKDYMK